MSKPFEVYIDCGTPNPVRFTLDEERIRASRSVDVMYALADDKGNPDDRLRLWRGALMIARGVVKASADGTVEVYDGEDVWVIPERSIRWVRLHDPESPDRPHGELGFRIEGQGGQYPARRNRSTRRGAAVMPRATRSSLFPLRRAGSAGSFGTDPAV
jgi:hypothetical protein